ncbi:MAG: hypothetical protein C4537_01555 [Acholeplasma sp.]|jgi:holo-ACP synthase CitX|nr:MAG: hypothetical protein C4537_01555 [Acholeplasma sp.]
MMNPILLGREARAYMIDLWLKDKNLLVLSIHANIPGDTKNLSEAFLLVHFFEYHIQSIVHTLSCERFFNDDGPYTLCYIQHDHPVSLKQTLVSLEDHHPLGRMIDLDLYDQMNHYSRNTLNLLPRKCYLCEDIAHHCIRSKKHSIEELREYVFVQVKDFLLKEVIHIASKAMMEELNLEDKFGLITPSSAGSHDDMDYELMLKAQKVILPYFQKLFLLGYESDALYHLFDQAREIGLEAEKDMLNETQGINCYKGLIFVLGWLMVSIGYVLKHHQTVDHIFTNVHHMTHALFDDFNRPPTTFGEKAYQTYQITGARGEAYLGFPSIHHALHILEHQPKNDQTLRMVLKTLILATDDTVMLKRSGTLENYQKIKKMFVDLDPTDLHQVKELTHYMIQERLSFGGAADLLIGTLVVHEIQRQYL